MKHFPSKTQATQAPVVLILRTPQPLWCPHHAQGLSSLQQNHASMAGDWIQLWNLRKSNMSGTWHVLFSLDNWFIFVHYWLLQLALAHHISLSTNRMRFCRWPSDCQIRRVPLRIAAENCSVRSFKHKATQQYPNSFHGILCHPVSIPSCA